MSTATLSDAAVVRQRDDLEMMKRPHLWPLNPALPLTKGHVNPMTSPAEHYGYLYATPEVLPIVYVGLPFLGTLTPVEYESLEAIVADGWIVD